MKTPLSPRLMLVLAISLGLSASANAASGTWTQLSAGNASGSWTTPGNWSGGTVASGSGDTADFNTLNITVDSTVTLDAPVTIGNIIFGDTTNSSAAGWTIGNAGHALTLAGTTPTITVNTLGTGKSVTIDTQVSGTDGLVKAGLGTLILNNPANNYTGTISNASMTVAAFGNPTFSTVVERGRLVLGNATAAGTGNILLNGASTTARLDLNGNTVANNIGLNLDTYLYNSNLTTAATVNGNIWVNNYGRIGGAIAGETGTVVLNGDIVLNAAWNSLYFNANGGLVVLNGTTSAGNYQIQGGVLRTNDVTNLNASSALTIAGGVFETGTNFTRTVGVAAGQVNVGGSNTGAGNGFSAFGAPVTVSLGGIDTPSALTWGTGNFLQSTSTLVLNAATANNTLTFTNAVDLNGATRTIAVHAATAVMSGNITNGTGTAGLTKTGVGILSLTGTNSYNGDTTISAGTLRGNTASLPGNIVNNAALVFDQAVDGTFASVISGSGTFEKAGAGILTLDGTNTFTGATTVSAGTLKLGNNAALGTVDGATTVLSGAAIDLNGRNIGGEEIRVNGSGVGGTGAIQNTSGTSATGLRLTLLSDATIGGSGRIDTAYSFTVINAGTHTLSKTGSGSFVINVGNTSMGTFQIQEGSVVVVNSATALGNTTYGTTVANGASLQFFNSTGSEIANSEQITLANGAELAGTTATSINTLNGAITLSGGTAKIRVENSGTGTLKIGGAISGTGGIEKISAGNLLLTATNTYTGNTTVTGGMLTLDDNAELRFVIGADGVNNTIDGVGNLVLNGDFRFDLTGASTIVGNSWQVLNVGTLTETFGGTFQALSTLGSFTNNAGIWTITENSATYQFSQATGILTVVPEPSTWGALLAAALFAMAFIRRRRRLA